MDNSTQSQKTTNILLMVLVAFVLIQSAAIVFLWKQSKDASVNLEGFKTLVSDDMVKYKAKSGEEIAQVKTAVFASVGEAKAGIEQLNKNGANIKSVIDKNTQSLLLINKTVGGMLTGKTTISGYDTVKTKIAGTNKDTSTVFPNYGISDSTQWYQIKGNVGHDKYVLTPKFNDSTEVKGQEVSNGFFKAKVLTAQVLSKNPYATTTGVKSVVIKKSSAPVVGVIEKIALITAGFFLGKKLF